MSAVPAPPVSAATERSDLGEIGASIADPLPVLRSTPDFVGMPNGDRPLADESRFAAAQAAAGGWLLVAVASTLLLGGAGLAALVTWPYAVALFAVFVWLPAYLSVFRYAALFFEDPPGLTVVRPVTPVTVVVSGNAAPGPTRSALAYLAAQDYDGPLRVVMVGGGLSDDDVRATQQTAFGLGINLDILRGGWLGPAAACNLALPHVATPLVLTLQAGTCLHPSAVRLLVARLESSPRETAGVSGHAFVRNRRSGLVAEVLAAGSTRDVDTTRRVESLFQGAQVAEPACMVFHVQALRALNGLPDDPASAVAASWRFLERGWRVGYEPHALAFTTQPVTIGTAGRSRADAERRVAAEAHETGVDPQRSTASRFLGAVARSALARDVAFTLAGLQALALLARGNAALLVGYLLFVVPIALVTGALARRNQREVLDETGLSTPRRLTDQVAPLLGLQAVQGPAAIAESLRGRPPRRRRSPRALTRRRLARRGPRYA